MPNDDTAPIPVQPSVVRPGTRAVAFLFAAGVLLVVSTFLDLVTLPLPGADGESQASITAWGLDLGIGHTIQQYVGVVTLIAGVALIAIAAASLRPEFGWTRNASLVAGGLGVAAGLFLAASGYSTGTFLSQLASATGTSLTPSIGAGTVLAVLGAIASMVAVASPVRRDALVVVLAEPVVYELDEERADED